MKIRAYATLLLASCCLATLGCTGDSTTGPVDQGPSGQYNLVGIDQVGLPAQVSRGPGTHPGNHRYYNSLVIVVNSGQFAIVDDRQWVISFNLDVTTDGVRKPTAFYAHGTFESRRGEIVLVPDDGLQTQMYGTVTDGQVDIGIDLASIGGVNEYHFGR
jgi:hypothetical protein